MLHSYSKVADEFGILIISIAGEVLTLYGREYQIIDELFERGLTAEEVELLLVPEQGVNVVYMRQTNL